MKKILQYVGVSVGIVGIIVGASILVDRIGFAEEKVEGFRSEESVPLPEIYIKAINPGYSVDGILNVGEMIEIGKRDADAQILLAGLTISYTNSSGNEAVIVEFPENSWMAGESILLRLASSSDGELANLNYAKTLAFKAGPLVISRGDEIIDSVCWTGKDGCLEEFRSVSPTTLVRDVETGEFRHEVGYEPVYDETAYKVDGGESGESELSEGSRCMGLEFSEILSYYEESQSEQFVEFYNAASEQVLLDGCMIRYKNKDYLLSGIMKPDSYMARYLDDFKITKNPNNYNMLEIIDVNGEVVDRLEYPNGQKKGTAYARIGYDANGREIWRVTYAVTPGEPNNYQEYKSCEIGKVINEETGNCVKVTEVAEKICGEGQYLNPLTGRCKKIEMEKVPKECDEGYYLNEETGRCRKIQENKGAEYGLVVEEHEEISSFVALYAIIGVVVAGVALVIFEFRREIIGFLRKVWRRFR